MPFFVARQNLQCASVKLGLKGSHKTFNSPTYNSHTDMVEAHIGTFPFKASYVGMRRRSRTAQSKLICSVESWVKELKLLWKSCAELGSCSENATPLTPMLLGIFRVSLWHVLRATSYFIVGSSRTQFTLWDISADDMKYYDVIASPSSSTAARVVDILERPPE